jgi:hypothetical protein
MTDEPHSYFGLEDKYVRKVTSRAYEYSQGRIHTRGKEYFRNLV